MAKFEYEFSEQDRQLTINQDVGKFGNNQYDYIRLIVYPSEAIDNIVDLPDDTKGVDGKAIFYSSLNEFDLFNINISPFTDELNEIRTKTIGSSVNGGKGGDFKIYRTLDSDGNPLSDSDIYIKPNEILNDFELPQGNYSIQIDFLNQVKPPFDELFFDDTGGEIQPAVDDNEHYQFIVKQISTSRKEVRLKLIDRNIFNNSSTITNLTNEFNNFEPEFLDDGEPNPNYKYQFKHVLNIGDGDHNPIMNYQFDRVTDGRNNQSIILKLYDALPSNISNLTKVSIEKEIIITQIENIFYFSDVPAVFFGDGLEPQPQENWLNPDGNEVGFQNYDELSGSLDDVVLDSLVSESQYNYPNLNTDFIKFENHTFFGSAKKKLENFKTKVETIQGYYSEIETSLTTSGSVEGDSFFVIQQRKDLFKKINDEIRTFTPYERFLYFDGQSESSASAPGLGKNYADIEPVQLGGDQVEGITLNGHDGFNVVYKHTSEKISGNYNRYMDLFSDKYIVENKPFFNYSGSIYLSFLMKGTSGSSITWENRNPNSNNSLGASLPFEAFHQTEISNPNITGSKYQRYIFEASQSYWTPEGTIDNDVASITTWSGSSEYNILSTSTKTGSVLIKDSTGLYPTTVVSSSAGIPFKGSIMPAGELFRIYIINELSESLQGHWNIDDVTSGSSLSLANVVNDAGPTTGDADVIISATASAGVEAHGRQYGTSFYIVSASNGASAVNEGIRFESTNFNYSKDDNFSMAIWVKRFHPDTGSADSSVPDASGKRQEIFMRGSTTDSYGIDYHVDDNQFRAGARSGSNSFLASKTMTDDGLNWHHVAFTYESGSSTGVKLYVDGVLEATNTNIGIGEFSASSPTGNNSISIGQTSTLSGNGSQFNGFLQYPRVYDRILTPAEVNQLYLQPDGVTETKITDVKVTLVNPNDVLPFDNLYHTSSANWINWYNGTYDSASAFDNDNIHSLENNLPEYIRESSDYNEMKDFLNLKGEQYDVIRNHIDSLGTIHNRGYKKTDSAPENIYPILLNNMGWSAINPFSGSLADSLGNYLTGVTSIDDIKNNTWRKTLNNLLYIYKSKGTKNSVRALLNVYGYPPDVIGFQEFGGGSDNYEFSDDLVNDGNISVNSASFGFNVVPQTLHRYMFQNKSERILNLDWWMDDANLETIEFVYKHKQTNNEQKILESSGSGAETLWDLRLIPSASTTDVVFSRFQFRLNNSNTGSLTIADNAVSMSTIDLEVRDGELWNVMLQRMTSSISGSGTNEYRLHAALQEEATIETLSSVTMSISGGYQGDTTTEGGKGFYANQNWQSSGSRNYLSSSNLFVGETFSGSLAEIKGWKTALSASAFKKHVLNKFSIVGNGIESADTELVYHFKLNENYSSGSVSSSNQLLTIVDSAPKCSVLLTTDYSFQKSGSMFTGSAVYGVDTIQVLTFGFHDNIVGDYNFNDNNVIVIDNNEAVSDLSPVKPAIESLTNPNGKKPKVKTSPKLEINRSPQDAVNSFILSTLDGFNFENYYGNPKYYYSSSYAEFDTFRKDFFRCFPVKVDVNKFVRAHENMFNHSLSEGLKTLIPARSTFSDINSNAGVTIKPTILEKQKYENEKYSVESINPFSGSIEIVSKEIIMSGSKLELPISSSMRRGYTPFGIPSSESSLIIPSISGSKIELPYSASIKVSDSGSKGNPYLGLAYTSLSSSIINPYSASMTPSPSLTGSGIVTSKNGTIDYALTANESYTSVHKNWGTSSADVQHINFAAATGSYGTFNTYDIDTRFVFHMIGDTEIYSGSRNEGSFDYTDFSNPHRLHNRVILSNDIHSGVTYESFITGSPGGQTGRMMGKTRYFTTSSTGEIILPRNHISKFSQPFKKQMIDGAQNINPGFLKVQHEDYSSASFYRVKVTGGESSLVVGGTGLPSLDSDNKIIY